MTGAACQYEQQTELADGESDGLSTRDGKPFADADLKVPHHQRFIRPAHEGAVNPGRVGIALQPREHRPRLQSEAACADQQKMRHELTSEQAIAIALLRQRHPNADVSVQRSIGGVIVEARENDNVVELLRADYYGRCDSDQQLPHAA